MPLSDHARSSPPAHVETFIIVMKIRSCIAWPGVCLTRLGLGPRDPAPSPGPRALGSGPSPGALGPGSWVRAPGPGPGARAPGPIPELRPPARAPGPGPRPWAPGPGLRGCAGNPIMYPAVRCSLDPLSLIRFRSSPSCTWNPPGDIEPKARGTLQEDQDPEGPRVSIIDSLVSTSTS